MYFMAFDTMFHLLSFHGTNLGHTKPRGLGYKLDMLNHMPAFLRQKHYMYQTTGANSTKQL